MAAKRKNELIACDHFQWLVTKRKGVFYADGRSNAIDVGRHSLGTRNRDEALSILKKLDLVQAVDHGLAERNVLDDCPNSLSLTEGRKLYEDFINRPAVVGGIRPASKKRYRAVLDKFAVFAESQRINLWNQITTATLEKYAAYLEELEYAYATQYLELTCLKQVVKWLAQEGHLQNSSKILLSMSKPSGSSTYCWKTTEVRAMVDLCHKNPDLRWLENVIIALACTGLRISELAALRWSDIDFSTEKIQLTDTSKVHRKHQRSKRTTKSGRNRSFPLHKDLLAVLRELNRSPDGFVFHGPLGGRLKPDTVRNILVREVLEKLAEKFPSIPDEVGFIDGRLHSFRHYFCSTCASSGVPERIVMDWLGHADSKMVRHYFHLHDHEAQRQMKKLDFLGDSLTE